jgi:hypothetical protein
LLETTTTLNTTGFADLVEPVAHEFVNFMRSGDFSTHPRMADDSRKRQTLSRVVLEHSSNKVFKVIGTLVDSIVFVKPVPVSPVDIRSILRYFLVELVSLGGMAEWGFAVSTDH